jgi:GT2 family glycosyltransferase
MDTPTPYFSVVILCWNSNQTIAACLEALDSQIMKDFEVLLVDNGSSKPISSDLVGKFPRLIIKLYTLGHNAGFAGGNNYAAARACGSYLILLNADAFPTPDWLERIQAGIEKFPGCFFASRLVMANHPERLDGAGDVYHVSGLAWRNSFNTLISKVNDREGEVFSACAAASAYPLDAFKRVNGFDEDYFSYIEDVDLGFRLRLLGYKCIYLPTASVYHVGSASTARRSDLAVYYGQRNLVWTFFKDMPGMYVWLLAPLHILTNLLQVALAILRHQGRITWKAKVDAVRGLSKVWQKRRQIQGTRTVPVQSLLSAMDWNPFSPVSKLVHR